MVANEEVVERVMRSGIEFRAFKDINKLFDFTKRQIAVEKQKMQQLLTQTAIDAGKPSTMSEYFDHCVASNIACYIGAIVDGKLTILRVDKIRPTKIFSWGRFKMFPYVEFA